MRARTALPFLCVLALLAPSTAGAHTLDRPAKLDLEARSELQHDALHHSTSVLRFFGRHPKIMRKPYHARIARREIRFHRKQRVWTKRELRETTEALAALRAASAPAQRSYTVWDRLVICEAGGNWATNTGNGYYGGLQHSLSTWYAYGGSGYPHHASREQQIAVAERVLAGQGWNAWPSCSAQLGLR